MTTEAEGTYVLCMYLNGGTNRHGMPWLGRDGMPIQDEERADETLLSLYDGGLVFPDARGHWALTAAGRQVAIQESLRLT